MDAELNEATDPLRGVEVWSNLTRVINSNAVFFVHCFSERFSLRFLSSFCSMNGRGSKPFTSAAMWVANAEASNLVMGPTPDLLAVAPAQVVSRVNPSGLIIPNPEITTLRLAMGLPFNYVCGPRYWSRRVLITHVNDSEKQPRDDVSGKRVTMLTGRILSIFLLSLRRWGEYLCKPSERGAGFTL